MIKQQTAISAVRTQLEILSTISVLENLGFVVEPQSTNEKQNPMNIANHLYHALTCNADIIYDALNIISSENKELFDDSLRKYENKHTVFTDDDVKTFLFGPHYAEIRDTYINEDDNELYIDAWKTDSGDEEGVTIAKINCDTGCITYIDATAMTDVYAQEVINENVNNICNRKEF